MYNIRVCVCGLNKESHVVEELLHHARAPVCVCVRKITNVNCTRELNGQ